MLIMISTFISYNLIVTFNDITVVKRHYSTCAIWKVQYDIKILHNKMLLTNRKKLTTKSVNKPITQHSQKTVTASRVYLPARQGFARCSDLLLSCMLLLIDHIAPFL